MFKKIGLLTVGILLALSSNAFASTYSLPDGALQEEIDNKHYYEEQGTITDQLKSEASQVLEFTESLKTSGPLLIKR